MVLLVTLTSNNVKYVRISLDLKSLIQLSKQLFNRPNIIYTVAQINKKGFGELNFFLIAITLTQSAVQKTMVFVETISEGIAIAKYFRRQFLLTLQLKVK